MNIWKRLVALIVIFGSNSLVQAKVAEEFIKNITEALPVTAPAEPKKPRKLLVFSLTNGFRHASIATGAKALQMMGDKTGAFQVTHTEDASVFEPENLANYDAVLMLNTSGEVFKPKQDVLRKLDNENRLRALQRESRLRQSLVDFVSSGKGLAGFHAATDTYKNWDTYNQLMGGAFASHPWNSKARVSVRIDDPDNVLTRVFQGKAFNITDEIYQYRDDTCDRSQQRILLSLNPNNTDLSIGKRKNGDYPIAWVRDFGKGRVFYSSLGHNHHIYWDPTILQFYLAGLQFVMGDLEGVETTPVPLN